MISTNTYGSHKNRPFKDESHKGSAETMDGEEKKDASKEDLDQEGGECVCVYLKCVLNLWNLNTSHSEPSLEKYFFFFFCSKQPPFI